MGLRRYGKTSLLKTVTELLLEGGMKGVMIDCLRVYNGSDLLYEFLGFLEDYNVIDDRAIIREIKLCKKGVILKIIKGKKNVHYIIRDRLFSFWLATNTFLRLKKLSLERARLLYIGLEAITREIFLTLIEPITIIDVLGHELTIEPTKEVRRYEGELGEVDMIALTRSNITYVAEVYGGLKCPKSKIDELLRAINIAEIRGYKNIIGLLITYFSTEKETINYAKHLWESGTKIYILTEEHLKK